MLERANYNNFNNDEDTIYKKNIAMIRSNIYDGVKFDLACEFISVEDGVLKGLIIDDALKIEVAELHYGQGLSLHDVSKKLGVSMNRLLKVSSEMIEDVLNTATEAAEQSSARSEPHSP